MIKRLIPLLDALHSTLTPAFHVTQLLSTGDQRSLHLTHQPGHGYTLYEEYRDPREHGWSLDSETWEDTLSRREALTLFRQYGASLAALQAARENRSMTALVPEQALLQMVTRDGANRFLNPYQHRTAQSFLQDVKHLIRKDGPPRCLIGRTGDHEVAWQALFDVVPWGKAARSELQHLHT